MATGSSAQAPSDPLLEVLQSRLLRECRRQARLAQLALPKVPELALRQLAEGLPPALQAEQPAAAVQLLLASSLRRAAQDLGYDRLPTPTVVLLGPAISGNQLAEVRRVVGAALAARRGPELLVLADRETGAAALMALGHSEDLVVFEAEDLAAERSADPAVAERPVARIEWVRFESGQLMVSSGMGPLPVLPANTGVAPSAAKAGQARPGEIKPQAPSAAPAVGPLAAKGPAPVARSRQASRQPNHPVQPVQPVKPAEPAARPSGPTYDGFVVVGPALQESRGERCAAERSSDGLLDAQLLRFAAPSGDRRGALDAWRQLGVRALALSATGLAPLWAAGIDADSRPWLVRPRPRGSDLRQQLAWAGPLRGAALEALALTLGRALGAAHAAGLAHGDLRPDWVEYRQPVARPRAFGRLLSETEGATWQVFELGLAPLVGPAESPLDQSPAGLDLQRPKLSTWPRAVAGFSALGAADYAAPELAAAALTGTGSADPRAADRFGLGVLLFEAASGRLPLSGYPSSVELLTARAAGRGDRARQLSGLSTALAQAIDELLEPRPERRAQDLTVWAAALEQGLARERQRARRRRVGVALAVLLASAGSFASLRRPLQANESLGSLECALSPARTELLLSSSAWPKALGSAKRLALVDQKGQPVSGWRLERNSQGDLLLKAPWSWPTGVESLSARLSIDGRVQAQPVLQLHFVGAEAWDLAAPDLQNPLGERRPIDRIEADELDQWSLCPRLSGAAEWVETVELVAGGERLTLGPSERQRGLPLERVLTDLHLPKTGNLAFEVVAQDRAGGQRRRSILLEISPPTATVASGPTGEMHSGAASGGQAPLEATGSAKSLAPQASDGSMPLLDGSTASWAAGREPGLVGISARAELPATTGAASASEDATNGTAAALAPQLPLIPESALTSSDPGAGAESGNPVRQDSSDRPNPEWSLKLDGLNADEIYGPASRPRLLLAFELSGPSAAPAIELKLGREGSESAVMSRRLEAESWRQLETGAWRSELALPAPWRASADQPPEADGRYRLWVDWVGEGAGTSEARLLERSFEVAVLGPRLEWAPPPGGLLVPGPDGSLLIGLYAADPNGVASIAGELLLASGVRRALEFIGDPAQGAARLRLEAEDSSLLARLEISAQDRHGAASHAEFGPLRVGLLPGYQPANVAAVPRPAPSGAGLQSETLEGPQMRLVPGNPTPYLFGGRADPLENELFREAHLKPFQPDERQALPRSWAIELPAQALAPFLLDEREVNAAEFLAFVEAPGGWLEPAWWPAGAVPGNSERRHALGAQLAGSDPAAPATGMTWEEAAAFAAWCGKRLPTWAEFEYALRGGARYRPYASYVEALALSAEALPERAFAGFAAAPAGPRAANEGEDRTPDTGLLGLSGNVAEWTATPVWFDLAPGERPPTPRQALLERLDAFLDPEWARARPEAQEFWVAGGHFSGRDFDFAAAQRLPRQRGKSSVGLRCALSMNTYLDRLRTRLAAPAGEDAR